MGSVNPHYCGWCGKKFHSEVFYNNKHFGMFIPFAKEFCSPRCRSYNNNQKRRDDTYKSKSNQPNQQAPKRHSNKQSVEKEYVQPKTIVERKKTKEEIDLEFYERQKQLELQQLEESIFEQKQEKLVRQKQKKFDKAKEFLANGGNKNVYYLNLLWAYLDKPWKKIAFIFLIWVIIASIFGEIGKLFK